MVSATGTSPTYNVGGQSKPPVQPAPAPYSPNPSAPGGYSAAPGGSGSLSSGSVSGGSGAGGFSPGTAAANPLPPAPVPVQSGAGGAAGFSPGTAAVNALPPVPTTQYVLTGSQAANLALVSGQNVPVDYSQNAEGIAIVQIPKNTDSSIINYILHGSNLPSGGASTVNGVEFTSYGNESDASSRDLFDPKAPAPNQIAASLQSLGGGSLSTSGGESTVAGTKVVSYTIPLATTTTVSNPTFSEAWHDWISGNKTILGSQAPGQPFGLKYSDYVGLLEGSVVGTASSIVSSLEGLELKVANVITPISVGEAGRYSFKVPAIFSGSTASKAVVFGLTGIGSLGVGAVSFPGQAFTTLVEGTPEQKVQFLGSAATQGVLFETGAESLRFVGVTDFAKAGLGKAASYSKSFALASLKDISENEIFVDVGEAVKPAFSLGRDVSLSLKYAGENVAVSVGHAFGLAKGNVEFVGGNVGYALEPLVAVPKVFLRDSSAVYSLSKVVGQATEPVQYLGNLAVKGGATAFELGKGAAQSAVGVVSTPFVGSAQLGADVAEVLYKEKLEGSLLYFSELKLSSLKSLSTTDLKPIFTSNLKLGNISVLSSPKTVVLEVLGEEGTTFYHEVPSYLKNAGLTTVSPYGALEGKEVRFLLNAKLPGTAVVSGEVGTQTPFGNLFSAKYSQFGGISLKFLGSEIGQNTLNVIVPSDLTKAIYELPPTEVPEGAKGSFSLQANFYPSALLEDVKLLSLRQGEVERLAPSQNLALTNLIENRVRFPAITRSANFIGLTEVSVEVGENVLRLATGERGVYRGVQYALKFGTSESIDKLVTANPNIQRLLEVEPVQGLTGGEPMVRVGGAVGEAELKPASIKGVKLFENQVYDVKLEKPAVVSVKALQGLRGPNALQVFSQKLSLFKLGSRGQIGFGFAGGEVDVAEAATPAVRLGTKTGLEKGVGTTVNLNVNSVLREAYGKILAGETKNLTPLVLVGSAYATKPAVASRTVSSIKLAGATSTALSTKNVLSSGLKLGVQAATQLKTNVLTRNVLATQTQLQTQAAIQTQLQSQVQTQTQLQSQLQTQTQSQVKTQLQNQLATRTQTQTQTNFKVNVGVVLATKQKAASRIKGRAKFGLKLKAKSVTQSGKPVADFYSRFITQAAGRKSAAPSPTRANIKAFTARVKAGKQVFPTTAILSGQVKYPEYTLKGRK